jgi:hypothetical protein
MKNYIIKTGYLNLIRINAVLYILTLIGLISIPAEYLDYFNSFLSITVSLFLILRFNPFYKSKFKNIDKQLVFSSALFIFSTNTINKLIIKHIKNDLLGYLPFFNSFI